MHILVSLLLFGFDLPTACPTFRISVAEAGRVRLEHSDLAAAGLVGDLPSAALRLSDGGEAVALWVEDGGDGRFGAGDWLEFRGERVAKDRLPRSVANVAAVYVLRCAPGPAPTPELSTRTAASASRVEHLEEDRIFIRLPAIEDDTELWYWHKLVSGEAGGFSLPLGGVTPGAEIRLHLRGWSRPTQRQPGLPDHRVEVTLDGRPHAAFEWTEPDAGSSGATFVLPPLPPTPPGEIRPRELQLRVPSRRLAGGALQPDVVLVDWVEVALGDDGGVDPPAPPAPSARRPARVELDTPSDWRSSKHRADLLVVGPRDLLRASEPLIERRRRQGLAVEVVDIQDVFDEWSHGLPDPRALRDFVAHAVRQWESPAPRYLLLVGDASWDLRRPDGAGGEGLAAAPDAIYHPEHGTEFAQVPAQSVAGEWGGARNRIPTWSYPTGDGHAAGDNFFVDVDGDLVPEVAVGRLPVVSAAEVRAVLDKLERYETATPGPWRSRVTFATSEDPGWHLWGDELAERAATRGFEARKVYSLARPQGDRSDPERVGDALGSGDYLFHFVGHGGRFIWRTGPPDWQKQRDLFNLDDVDRLPENSHPPIVVAMTCYSAPFDHPSADSIGEKLLRTPGKGAIAVLAAAWRISPTQLLSQTVLGEFLATQPGDRLGDVVLRAKKKSYNRDFLQQYNLLGDPSMPISPRP